MRIKAFAKRLIELSGYTIHRRLPGTVYSQDGLNSVHNHDFMADQSFCKAYERGVLAAESDYQWHWRVHIGLWAAYSASKLEGDFVECGVNRGFLSSAIMEYLDWDSLHKTFYLADTFCGMDERYITNEEIERGRLDVNAKALEIGFFVKGVESVRENFSQWKNVRIIEGPVPDILDAIDPKRIAFLHLDMNCSQPEVAAFNHLWDRFTPGAFILLDDYAHFGCEVQKAAMDAAAASKEVKIVSLPTGQGLVTKPA